MEDRNLWANLQLQSSILYPRLPCRIFFGWM